MIASTAPETLQMPGIGAEIGKAGIDHASRARHQFRKAPLPAPFGRGAEDEPQAFLDQVFELAAVERRRRLRLAVKLVRQFDGCLHRWPSRKTVKPYIRQV